MQPCTFIWEVVEADARQWLSEYTVDFFNVDEVDCGGVHCPCCVFVESEDGDLDSFCDECVELVEEVSAVCGCDDDVCECVFVVVEELAHVIVDVGIVGDFGFGEDGESDVSDGVDPGSDDFGASWCDVGEDGSLWGGVCGLGMLGEPFADGVESGSVLGVGSGAEDCSESHVHVWCVPDEEGGFCVHGGVFSSCWFGRGCFRG